jgi:tRNA nucleotidyltransferase/poly(A) polymerase
MDISKIILSDPVNRWIFSNAKKEVYLIGGYIRDLIRGNISKDKDFVLKGDVERLARRAANKFKGTFIVLKKNQTYRIVLKDRQCIDFTNLAGNIQKDLSRRDFTVNALAWSPDTGIVDRTGGKGDIADGIIRVINPRNLADDPLRVLRAYRLSAQSGFKIEAKTKKYLSDYSPGLKKVAPERITEELFKLINTEKAYFYLKMCLKHNVLCEIINIKSSLISNNLKLIEGFERFFMKIKTRRKSNYGKNRILLMLNENMSQGLKRQGLVRLALLLFDATAMFQKNYSHRLRCSGITQKKIRDIHNGLKLIKGRITRNKLFLIFNASGVSVCETALILSSIKTENRGIFINMADEFIKIKNKDILSGNEIQKILNIEPGRLVGSIKDAIQERQFKGYIKNRKEARDWILSNLT